MFNINHTDVINVMLYHCVGLLGTFGCVVQDRRYAYGARVVAGDMGMDVDESTDVVDGA